MKRVFLAGILIILVLSFISADDLGVGGSDDEQTKVNEAYDCLKEKVDDCSTSLEDNIFTLLATGKCKQEVLDASLNDECWPKSNCNIKNTAQAILALDEAGAGTSEAEDWLLSQNETPSDLIWYLEIESTEKTICEINYSNGVYAVEINEDKKISSNAGPCLTRAQDDYWLEISESCYDEKFGISCDKQFLTTLLFKKEDSSTIHISEKASSASAGGTTTEKINSLCFVENSACDYEGTLWAALVLDYMGYETSYYLPYLIAMKDKNDKYLPESFLYFLTDYMDFRNELLLKQKSNNYWEESGDRFYDTALALYPFQYEEIQEKANAKNWLLEVQQDDGCWDGGNIRNNAFILYSIWPRGGGGGNGNGEDDCEDAGYYCMSEINCVGNILESYDCAGTYKCCDTPKPSNTCFEQGGEICSSDETCTGTSIDADDLNYGETCCTEGICQTSAPTQTECELYGGTCRYYECADGEEESSYECEGSDICCVESKTEIAWWIWILVGLIILVLLGILFRNKLRPHYMRLTSMFRKGKPKTPPSFPGSAPPMRAMPRRILPPSHRPVRRPVPRRRRGEIDNVLKKLKDMGR